MNNSHILVRRNRQVNREKPPPRICPRCNSDNIRNISAGGSRIDQTSVAQVVPVETQQVNHHQPFLHGQETNDFLGSIGGSSSSAAVVGNHFGSLPETHGDMVFPFRSYPPMNRPVFNDGSFPQGYYHVGHVNNHNSYRVNQEDPKKPRQRFNNTMSMNHNTSTSGS
uniref:Dof-type domain-containing protein n=1 Tax=Brassica campestris TaxID=3711 RepID=M4DWL6_BRACM